MGNAIARGKVRCFVFTPTNTLRGALATNCHGKGVILVCRSVSALNHMLPIVHNYLNLNDNLKF